MNFHKLLLLVSLFTSHILSAQDKGYYRFPALYNDNVVFTGEGDLWKFNLKSGLTQRLTTHHGVESHPAISPDGKWIAFNAQYEGITEVYVMPLAGGIPNRLTYEDGGARNVYGWSLDGKVIYSTFYYSTLPNAQLVKIDPGTMEREVIPLAQADQGSYDDNGILYFTRFRKQGSHTKRYKGGTAQSIWKFNGASEATHLTSDYKGTSKDPMFYNGRLYFLSDRDGTMNVWSMDTDGDDLKQHSISSGWDLKDASIHEGKIVAQQGADIVMVDIEDNSTKVLDIRLFSDFDQRRKLWVKNPSSKISSASLSYSGDHVALTSRGRVFSAPVNGNRWSEVTRDDGIRYKLASFYNESDDIIMLSDKSGEFELWKTDNLGFKMPTQLTKGSSNIIMGYSVSPSSEYVVYMERDNRLKLYSVKSGTIKNVDQSRQYGLFGPYSWSPDSRWITYIDYEDNLNSIIKLYDVETGSIKKISTSRLDSYTPRFSSDGKWLYFVSDRNFKNTVGSPWGSRQPEPYYEKTSKVYALALDSKSEFPFLEETELKKEDDEENDIDESKKKKNKKEETEDDEVKVVIELSGLMDRLYEVPIPACNLSDMNVNEDYIYWSSVDNGSNKRSLKALKITNDRKNEPKDIHDDVRNFSFSGDGNKILIRTKKSVLVANADGSKPDSDKDKIDLKNWVFSVDPMEDWTQMLKDAWRMERDYFYDKNMHGVDWQEVLDRHLPLTSRLTDRHELDDLLGQMISELSALHMFVGGGNKRSSPDRITLGHLGAKLTRSTSNGGYIIDYIYRADPDYPDEVSPLAKSHLKIKRGDIITSVNGVSTLNANHINELLASKVGLQVRLRLKTAAGSAYEEIVKPISSGGLFNLRYTDWEYTRRLMVEEKSNDRIGYVHLRAMGGGNYNEWVKGFYPAFNREGLILDVRSNNGGNIDSWILEKLLRKAWFYWSDRVGEPTWNMQYAFRGHMVVLVDESTASDGEAFAEGFRRLGMGEVIGTRTWGGEIWLSFNNRLVDNGIASAAQSGVFGPEGEWLIEGVGVIPDQEIDNPPFETFNGSDAQLEKAIQHLKKLMEDTPIPKPQTPKFPDKSFDYER